MSKERPKSTVRNIHRRETAVLTSKMPKMPKMPKIPSDLGHLPRLAECYIQHETFILYNLEY